MDTGFHSEYQGPEAEHANDTMIDIAADGDAANVPLTISWFESIHHGIGDPEATTWDEFAKLFWYRREGPKDGPCFVPARFQLEADGRRVRRRTANVIARTAVTLDIEGNKRTRETPPEVQTAQDRVLALGLAGVVYTSHSHKFGYDIRYRIVLPLSEEIAPELPIPEVVARALGVTVLHGSCQKTAFSMA